ncbi:MAG: hypothetical protein LBN05_05650 [Oscillospiraceae bacterium]|jgi:hypothetical protein|nr:hypothetical protein [Oscillospiraceae bacterium]
MKKALWSLLAVALVAAIAVGGYLAFGQTAVPNPSEEPLETQTIEQMLTIDPTDLKQLVGHVEYVFVAYVVETYDYYSTKNERTFPAVLHKTDPKQPVTECVLKVVQNIKGSLKENAEISYYKMAGITENLDGKKIMVLQEDTFLPVPGQYYLFTGMGAQRDGTLTGGENVALEEGIDAKNLARSKIVQAYSDAFKNEVGPAYATPHFLVTSDVRFKPGINEKIWAEYKKVVAKENPELAKQLEYYD